MLQSIQVAHDRSGVYQMRNLLNRKKYVGSAEKSMKRRGHSHRNNLLAGKHVNHHLQRAWNKYGEKAFVFECLEFCNADEVDTREQYWIDKLEVLNPDKGYNIAKFAKKGPMSGRNHTGKSRQKMSDSKTGMPQSPEHVKTRSDSNRGKKRTEEAKAKMVAVHWSHREDAAEIKTKIGKGNRGLIHTKEQNQRTSEATKAAMTLEVCQKISVVGKGRKLTDTHRANVAAATTRRMQTVEARQKVSDQFRGKPLSQEHREKIRQAKLFYERRKRIGIDLTKPDSQRTLFNEVPE